MATAKRLPSGKYRCLVYVGTVNGKRKYKSFTADSKKKAEYAANAYLMVADRQERLMTISEAVERYIDLKRPVLSPSTIRGYVGQKKYFKNIDIPTESLTQAKLQKWVSDLSRKLSPKSVQNIYSLFCAAMKMFAPEMTFRVTIPRRDRPNTITPTDKDVRLLIDYFLGSEMEICIYLSAFGTMRRGEICALRHEDIIGDTILVRHALVRDENGQTVRKAPKTPASIRRVVFPHFVIQRIEQLCPGDPIITMPLNEVTKVFGRAVKELKLPHIRFHDLRHYSASIMHYLQVPEQYAMKRGGWASKQALTQIYEAALPDKVDGFTQTINTYFEDKFGL